MFRELQSIIDKPKKDVTAPTMRILLTGAGGMGGVNFVRALRLGAKLDQQEIFIVGTEFNQYHIRFPSLDEAVVTPRHSDPSFLSSLLDLARKYRLEFVHPNPSSEARVVAAHVEKFNELHVKTFLPSAESIAPDKETIWRKMKEHNVSVPDSFFLASIPDLSHAFKEMGAPLWLRPKEGAGARLSLKVNNVEEAELWIKLNNMQGRTKDASDYVISAFEPGRDIAFDSLWYKGRMVSSSARERLEYPLKHISLTGLTGTPSVARIICEDKITQLGIDSVRALDPNPHGFYSTDIKEDSSGNPMVTEVDGKWHTTAPLWGYSLAKATGDNHYNVAYTYLLLGNEKIEPDYGRKDLYPEGYTLVRQIDSGVVLCSKRSVESWRIL